MAIFFTSDTHFSHNRIIELCNRPFKSVSHMNEALIAKWNSVVSPTDTVYHLGDVALGSLDTWDGALSRLNGHKVLVIGNHDRLFRENKPAYVERFKGVYSQWFDSTEDNITNLVLSDGTNVNLSHFPYTGDSHDKPRYNDFRLADDGTVLLHGHTHADTCVSRSASGTLQVHVGVDAWDYTPVAEWQIIKTIKEAG